MTRYLLYSHDTYGLGHYRRCATLARGLVAETEADEVLIATGSPRAHAFGLPDRVDSVKLPAATKDSSGHYRPQSLGDDFDRLVRIRSEILLCLVDSYCPDVILVDHAPVGMAGEFLPVLHHIDEFGHRRPRLALGLRDIVDSADRVDESWHRDDVWDALSMYDQILVYGDPTVTTTAIELALDRRLSAPVDHTGYVAPDMCPNRGGENFVLVTAGGGGDGRALIRQYLSAVRDTPVGMPSVVLTGPLMPGPEREELRRSAENCSEVQLFEFRTDMRSLVSSATAVVSMAGYNTVVEELAAGVPALLVPREQPRLEQHLRASRVADHSELEHCALEDLTPERITQFVASASCRARRRRPTELDLSGASRAVELLAHARELTCA